MKKLIVAVAIVAAFAACKSQTKSSVSSGEPATMKADCGSCKDSGACKDKAACSGQQKADCGKTCPMSAKPVN